MCIEIPLGDDENHIITKVCIKGNEDAGRYGRSPCNSRTGQPRGEGEIS